MMSINVKRIYERPSSNDGYRVLVDRIWPRGVSKEKARLDEWFKDAAPSTELRKRVHSGEMEWREFRREYMSELKDKRELLRPLVQRARQGRVTLLFAKNDPERNNAVVLKQYLDMLDRG